MTENPEPLAELLDWIAAHDLHNDASFPPAWREVIEAPTTDRYPSVTDEP